jgi:hypothetical protein
MVDSAVALLYAGAMFSLISICYEVICKAILELDPPQFVLGEPLLLIRSSAAKSAKASFQAAKTGAEMARLYNISAPTVSRIVAQHTGWSAHAQTAVQKWGGWRCEGC